MAATAGRHAGPRHELIILLDVDNTLLDNDGVRGRLETEIQEAVGRDRAERFWQLYEQVREELDVVDFPEAMERFGRECDDSSCLGPLTAVLYGFRFSECLYPGAEAAIAHAGRLGVPVILTDGDQLFQRHKVRDAGLEAAVEGRVLVYVHKEQETADIQARFPADNYVMVDDKPRIHAAMKEALGPTLTTVFVRQGKYALAPTAGELRPPDVELASIGDFTTLTADRIRAAATDVGREGAGDRR